jgi:hypothetical protein
LSRKTAVCNSGIFRQRNSFKNLKTVLIIPFEFDAQNLFGKTEMEKRRMRKLLFTLALFCAILFGSSVETSAQTLLNEIDINTPSTDNPCEYIEIRGTPGATLTNTYFVAIEGDASSTGTGPGAADMVVDLSTRTIGSNGILVIVSPTACPGRTIPAGATQVTDAQLDTSGGGIENGTITFLLVTSTTPIVEGTDYDTNNDGTLEGLPAGVNVLDAIGVTDGNFGDIVYFGQVVTQGSGDAPNAITRFPANNTPVSSAAWYGGFLETAGGNSTTVYNTTNASANFPTGGALTPGAANVGTFVAKDVPVDFNGDGRSDYAVTGLLRGSTAQTKVWYIRLNGVAENSGIRVMTWGLPDDREVPEDYDGDGRDDIAVWRATSANQGRGFFYIFRSSNNTFLEVQFGTVGDDPTIVADYDGDNIADPAVYRMTTSAAPLPCGPNAGVWYYRPSATPAIGFRYICWGGAGDKPAPGDYDGDNRADAAVFRPNPGIFFVAKSSGGTEAVPFGASGDRTIPGDYDGDGRTDYAVARQGTQWSFFIRPSRTGSDDQTYQFGAGTDILAPGDYTGDGKTDIAVWRPADGTFYIRPAQTFGTADFAFKWGQQGDMPVAAYIVH